MYIMSRLVILDTHGHLGSCVAGGCPICQGSWKRASARHQELDVSKAPWLLLGSKAGASHIPTKH